MNDQRGPCSNCGAPLATDQRYCIECGNRVGPPIALPYLTSVPGAEQAGGKAAFFALPIPIQMATTFAAMALGFGVVIGTAISPNLSGIVASAPPPVPAPTVEEPTPSAPIVAGGGGGGPAPAPSSAALPETPASSGGGAGGGGGGGGKKKRKKKVEAVTVPVDGWVVQVNSNASSYTVAKLSGASPVTVVHSDDLPPFGQGIVTTGKRLFNGTLQEVGPRSLQGSSATASISGTVTYRDLGDDATDTDEEAYVVSSRGASILVRIPEDGGSPIASEVDPPMVGDVVTVPVEIRTVGTTGGLELTPPPPAPTGCPPPPSPFKPPTPVTGILEQGPGMGAPAATAVPTAEIEGIVQATCPGAGMALLSGDSIRERGVDIGYSVAPGIDLTRFIPGQSYVANIGLGAGTFTITGIASDQGAFGASDNLTGQGNLAGPPLDTGPAKTKKKKKKKKK